MTIDGISRNKIGAKQLVLERQVGMALALGEQRAAATKKPASTFQVNLASSFSSGVSLPEIAVEAAVA